MNREITFKTTNAIKNTLVFKSLAQIFGIAATILLVRTLSETEYGIYNLLYALIGLIGTIASLGISDTLQRYIPEYYQRGEFRIANNLIHISSVIRFIADSVILCFIIMLWDQIAPILKLAEYKTIFILFCIVILLHHQRNIVETGLSSYFLHRFTKRIAVIFSMIRATGYGIVIFTDSHLWYAVIVDTTAYIVTVTLLQIIYARKIPVSEGNAKRLSIPERKRLYRYAAFYNFNNSGLGILSANFDNFILVMMLTPAAVGAYAFCVRISIQLTSILPLKYFKDIIKPAFFSVGTSGEKHLSTNHFFQSLVKLNFIFAFPCFFFLILFIKDIIHIFFGGKFINYAPVLSTIFLFSIINAIPIGTVAQLREKANIILYSKIFAIYNLIADVILIYFFGIWGAVIATASATLAKNVFVWYFVREDANFKGMQFFFTKIVCFWSAAAIIIHHLLIYISPLPILRILIGLLFFSAAFFLQFHCNLFQAYEKNIFSAISADRKPWIQRVMRLMKMSVQKT